MRCSMQQAAAGPARLDEVAKMAATSEGRNMMNTWRVGLLCTAVFAASASAVDKEAASLKVDQAQVDAWNAFAEALYEVHQQRLQQHTVRTSERIGGYGGYLGEPDFYREVRYYDAGSGRLLSRIQWERKRPDVIHMIEVLFYDGKARVQRDYLAAYLPRFRNAPVQTLINFHNYDDGLHAFRQFDASGHRIYEQCNGTYFGDKVSLSLEEWDMQPYADNPELFDSPAYLACFEPLPLRAGPYLNPLAELDNDAPSVLAGTDVEAERAVARISARIAQSPSAQLHLERGQRHFDLGRFDAALQDFDRALEINDGHAEAHFWRGMVLGRMGRVDDSIVALDTYIGRNPMSSLAYTKRGVRHIWNGDLQRAERDLKQAIALDPNNAEAHDDLGVVYAQREAYQPALEHFQKTVSIDPSYQKGHHNRAMVLYLTGQLEPALQAANESQRLAPNDRGTVLLKGQILKAMGREQQAQALFDRAQFMSEDKDWTEQFAVQ